MKIAMRKMLWVALLVTCALTGCASMEEGPYRFPDGWRHAKVVEVLSGAEVKRPQFWTCLKGVAEQDRLRRTYVIANYRGVNRHQDRLVPLPDGEVLRPGDKVHLNVSSCDNAIVKRDEVGQRGP